MSDYTLATFLPLVAPLKQFKAICNFWGFEGLLRVALIIAQSGQKLKIPLEPFTRGDKVKLLENMQRGFAMLDYISDGAKILLIMGTVWALWHILPA